MQLNPNLSITLKAILQRSQAMLNSIIACIHHKHRTAILSAHPLHVVSRMRAD